MPSLIDPTKPADGMPANKDDMRANFAAIRQEIEHGGFYAGLGGSERAVRDYIAGQWIDVREFGARGDNGDDTLALQNALDSRSPLHFPPGDYRITAPLTFEDTLLMRGTVGKQQGGQDARILGDFPNPLLHWKGIRVVYDPATQQNHLVESSPAPSGGQSLVLDGLLFSQLHPDGSCIQSYNASSPVTIMRCGFESDGHGLMLLQGFNALVAGCHFTSSHFVGRSIAEGHWRNLYSCYLNGHAQLLSCDFKGCPTAVYAQGNQVSLQSLRIEVGGYGLLLGGPQLGPDNFGIVDPIQKSEVSRMHMESNYRHIHVRKALPTTRIANVGIFGGTNGPTDYPSGAGDFGLWMEDGGAVDQIDISGRFERTPIYFDGQQSIGRVLTNQVLADRPAMGASAQPISRRGSDYGFAVQRTTLNPTADGSMTAFHDLQLRGLKGLNLRDKTQPNSLGGIASVAPGAITHAVAFTGAKDAGGAAFQSDPLAVADGSSSLAAGTYYYASTLIGPRGETGINSLDAEGNNYRSVTVTSGERVDMQAFGGHPYGEGYVHRFYRGTRLGQFDGYFESGGSGSFSDTGQDFDGRDMPPSIGVSIPSLEEPDGNYAVVVTPSWDTTAWAADKAASGFAIHFGTAAPAGAQVQWLLFRP